MKLRSSYTIDRTTGRVIMGHEDLLDPPPPPSEVDDPGDEGKDREPKRPGPASGYLGRWSVEDEG
jgi:hypothetical protein